jgi:hypothetical protein
MSAQPAIEESIQGTTSQRHSLRDREEGARMREKAGKENLDQNRRFVSSSGSSWSCRKRARPVGCWARMGRVGGLRSQASMGRGVKEGNCCLAAWVVGQLE